MIYFEFIFILLQFLLKPFPASLFFVQAYIGKRGLFARECFFQLFAMPGDRAILKEVPAALSATYLLNPVAVKVPPFWPDNI